MTNTSDDRVEPVVLTQAEMAALVAGELAEAAWPIADLFGLAPDLASDEASVGHGLQSLLARGLLEVRSADDVSLDPRLQLVADSLARPVLSTVVAVEGEGAGSLLRVVHGARSAVLATPLEDGLTGVIVSRPGGLPAALVRDLVASTHAHDRRILVVVEWAADRPDGGLIAVESRASGELCLNALRGCNGVGPLPREISVERYIRLVEEVTSPGAERSDAR